MILSDTGMVWVGLTLNPVLLASTAAATGPAYVTAACKDSSLPLVMAMMPDMEAPTYFDVKLQVFCCTSHMHAAGE